MPVPLAPPPEGLCTQRPWPWPVRVLAALGTWLLALVVGTAVVARLFSLTQPALLQLPWFAWGYAHWLRSESAAAAAAARACFVALGPGLTARPAPALAGLARPLRYR